MGARMKPDFRIEADGADATVRIRDRLLSLTVTEEDGEKADRLSLRLDDRDGRLEFPEIEAKLELWLGFRGQALSYIGQFEIDGVSGKGGPDTMTISATAIDLKSPARAPRSRAWENKSLSDIVGVIAGEAGLEPVVSDSIAGQTWPYLAQTAESDLNFLTRIAAELDATAKAAGGRLIVAKRGEDTTPGGDEVEAVVIARNRLQPGWTWDLNEREKYGTVEAEWADTGAGQQRKVKRGSDGPVRRIRHVYSSEQEADRAAQAELDKAQRRRLKINATLAGFEPALYAGGRAEFTGLRRELSGEWHVEQVTHELGAGLFTSLRARKDFAEG